MYAYIVFFLLFEPKTFLLFPLAHSTSAFTGIVQILLFSVVLSSAQTRVCLVVKERHGLVGMHVFSQGL